MKSCLCCANNFEENQLNSLFQHQYDDKLLYEIYFKVTHFEILENENFDKYICLDCSDQLYASSAFIDKCQRTLIELKNSYFKDSLDEKKSFDNTIELIDLIPSTLTKNYACLKCGRNFLNQKTLNRHLARVHQHGFICKICGKECQFSSSLAEHMKTHTGEKPHLCPTCGKGFRQSGSLTYHMRSHDGTKPYKCSYCDVSFATKDILKIHIRRHTDERPYVCDVCGRAFRQNNDMHSHKRTQHGGHRPYSCSYCDKKLASSGALTVHIRIHTGEKPFNCESCEKRFITRALLQRHTVVHTRERPFKCTLCSGGFTQKSSLRTHMQLHNKNL